MRRIGLIATIVLGLLAGPLAHAQQAKVWRIGVMLVGWSTSSDPPRAFQQGLRELGYVEGQNITIEWRAAEGAYDRVPRLVAELVRLKPDVLVVDSTLATRTAKQATATIPIVMAIVADAVGSGLVASLARPGGNVTGNSFMMIEISAKQLQLLKETLPRLSRVAVLWNPTTPFHRAALKEIEAAAPALRMRLQPISVRGANEFERAFSSISKGGADSLFVIADPLFKANESRLLELASKYAPVDIRRARLCGRWRSHRLWRELPRCFAAPRPLSTGSSKAPSPRTSPWSNPRNSSWSST